MGCFISSAIASSAARGSHPKASCVAWNASTRPEPSRMRATTGSNFAMSISGCAASAAARSASASKGRVSNSGQWSISMQSTGQLRSQSVQA